MSKGKTGLIVLTVLAAMFFLFVAILFGSSAKRQGSINRITSVNDSFDSISEQDLKIYWIGDPPSSEYEHLFPVINVISYNEASKNTLPVKSPEFHTAEYNSDGELISEAIPVEYPRYMFIVITGKPELTDAGREALLDAISRNGVPVLAIGGDAADFLGGLLCYSRLKTGPDSSLYYCLGAGYKENPIPEEAIVTGGLDLAEAIPDLVSLAMTDYKPQI